MKLLVFLFMLSMIEPLVAEPWSISPGSPVIAERSFVLRAQDDSFWNNRFDYGYYFYQKAITPADGPRCGLYPTCADYGYQAIQKHGPFLGGWMATDRLMRDNGKNMETYPLIDKFGKMRHYDPVSNNDFWFTH